MITSDERRTTELLTSADRRPPGAGETSLPIDRGLRGGQTGRGRHMAPPMLTGVYAVVHWRVRRGAEGAFVAEWESFSQWLITHPGAGGFTLVQDDTDDPHFVSISRWSQRGVTAPWPEFLERLGRCRALCEASRGRTFRLLASLDQAA
jgi:Antibiotic biosynthesis monooxygenase